MPGSPLQPSHKLSPVLRALIQTRHISDHQSTTLPTGRQSSVHSPLSPLTLFTVFIKFTAPDKLGSEVPGAAARSAEQRSAHPHQAGNNDDHEKCHCCHLLALNWNQGSQYNLLLAYDFTFPIDLCSCKKKCHFVLCHYILMKEVFIRSPSLNKTSTNVEWYSLYWTSWHHHWSVKSVIYIAWEPPAGNWWHLCCRI